MNINRTPPAPPHPASPPHPAYKLPYLLDEDTLLIKLVSCPPNMQRQAKGIATKTHNVKLIKIPVTTISIYKI